MKMISARSILVLSALLRAILIAYGEWQDKHLEVRYTDVDYLVFSDAAELMASGKSPYGRTTYRYSPLLAFLLLPNSYLHQSWGKLLFSSAGMFCLDVCVFFSSMCLCCNIAFWLWLSNLMLQMSMKLARSGMGMRSDYPI